jgi:hypothetical protein
MLIFFLITIFLETSRCPQGRALWPCMQRRKSHTVDIYNMNCFNQCPIAASEINVFVICIFREKHFRYGNIINAAGKMLVKYNILATTRYFNVHMTVLYACEEIPRFSVI